MMESQHDTSARYTYMSFWHLQTMTTDHLKSYTQLTRSPGVVDIHRYLPIGGKWTCLPCAPHDVSPHLAYADVPFYPKA